MQKKKNRIVDVGGLLLEDVYKQQFSQSSAFFYRVIEATTRSPEWFACKTFARRWFHQVSFFAGTFFVVFGLLLMRMTEGH